MGETDLDHLDERGRATVKPRFRPMLRDGFVQILTPDGVTFARPTRRLKTDAPSLGDVDDEALRDV